MTVSNFENVISKIYIQNRVIPRYRDNIGTEIYMKLGPRL